MFGLITFSLITFGLMTFGPATFGLMSDDPMHGIASLNRVSLLYNRRFGVNVINFFTIVIY